MTQNVTVSGSGLAPRFRCEVRFGVPVARFGTSSVARRVEGSGSEVAAGLDTRFPLRGALRGSEAVGAVREAVQIFRDEGRNGSVKRGSRCPRKETSSGRGFRGGVRFGCRGGRRGEGRYGFPGRGAWRGV